MKLTVKDHAISKKSANCPYCGGETKFALATDYAPKFVYCDVCGARFIAERLAKGYQLLTVEEAPCYSNPDCRELEMGAYDEE